MSPDQSAELAADLAATLDKPQRAPRPARAASPLDDLADGETLSIRRSGAVWIMTKQDATGIRNLHKGPERPNL